MRLLLIRRAETDRNAALTYGGANAVPLNAAGRAQAKALGTRLAHYGATVLYTSDTAAAAETASVVGAALGLAPEAMPALRDIDVGQWESATPEELYRRFPDHLRELVRDPARPLRPGGESYAQLFARVQQTLDTLAAAHPRDAAVLAITHGGAIRAALHHVIQLELGRFASLWIDPTAITELHHGHQGWRLARLNDSAHLESLAR